MQAVDERAIRAAVDVLECSGLVAMPTETVYGLAANAEDEKAIKKIFEAKNRPTTHPLIVHITGEEALDHWAKEIPQSAYVLARRFWPGPLTMILKKSDAVGDWITGGQDSVGLRCPSHPWAMALIKAFAGKHHRGLAAPSANTFGRISPTTAQHVRDDLGEKPKGKVDFILDGGECDVGVESTIINLSGEHPEILRHGAITRNMLEEALGCAVPDGGQDSPRVSGSLKSHYAPKTKVILSSDIAGDLKRYQDKKVAIMASKTLSEQTPTHVIKWFVAPESATEYMHDLYVRLHELDQAGADLILIETPPTGDAWNAVQDRLARASA